MKKICQSCGKEFTPIESHHTTCPECWHKTARHCRNCGKQIEGTPKNFYLCKECYYKSKR